MKKLLLLVGLVVFLAPTVVSAASLEEQLAEYENKYCQNNVENKIAILHPDGYFDCTTQQAKDKLLNQNNTTSLVSTDNSVSKKEYESSIKDKYNYCKRENGKYYKSAFDCSPNLTVSKQKFDLSRSKFCQKSNNEVYVSTKCKQNDRVIDQNTFSKLQEDPILTARKRMNIKSGDYGTIISEPRICIDLATGRRINCGITLQKKQGFCFDHATGNRISCGVIIPKKKATFNEFALSLGCGPKSKNVDDCVRRYLPSLMGQGPMTMKQINEIKNNEEIMGEVVFAIAQMNRGNSQSNEPSEEEQRQAQATQGNQQHKYRGYNPIAERIWNKMGWTTLRRNPTSMSTFSHTYIGS